MTTTIQRNQSSNEIKIPQYILDIVKWNEGEQIEIITENDKIIIEKTQKRKTIAELFAGYDGEYEPQEIDWGNPMGGEIW